MLHRRYAITIIFVVTFLCVSAQSKWKYSVISNFGCNVFLNFGKKQNFPGIRAYAALSIIGVRNNRVLLHYGPSISVYSKTIGANLNPLVGDIQIDFTNTFSGGLVWGNVVPYYKQLRTLHNGDFYNLIINQRNAVLVSTNFIVNNHRRNQIIGALSGTFNNFSFSYNNDAIPFDWVGLSDGFDRYWTGGATLFFHTKEQFNRVEFGYDQFTGYQPKLYELANILGINIPQYSNKSDRHIPSSYNTSIYQLKIGFDRSTSLDVGAVGSMYANGKYYGFQDIIHLLGHFSFHPNQDPTRIFVGGSFIKTNKIE